MSRQDRLPSVTVLKHAWCLDEILHFLKRWDAPRGDQDLVAFSHFQSRMNFLCAGMMALIFIIYNVQLGSLINRTKIGIDRFQVACLAGGIVGARNNVLTAEPLKASGETTRTMGKRTLKYRLHENHGFLNSPHTSVRENRLVERKYTRQSNVKWSLVYFPWDALLCFAYGKLFVKIIAASIEDSIVAALYHLHVSRKKEKIIHKKEQETVVKERFVVNRTVRIKMAIWIYDPSACFFVPYIWRSRFWEIQWFLSGRTAPVRWRHTRRKKTFNPYLRILMKRT